MAQSVEHVIGNDEVISSILITSSKKQVARLAFFIFFFLFQKERRVPIDKDGHILTLKEVVPIKIPRTPKTKVPMGKQGGDGFCELGSLTAALRAQEALAAAAIPSTVEKTESPSSRRGCTYGIRFFRQQENNVRAVLAAARIPVKAWNAED